MLLLQQCMATSSKMYRSLLVVMLHVMPTKAMALSGMMMIVVVVVVVVKELQVDIVFWLDQFVVVVVVVVSLDDYLFLLLSLSVVIL
jgi:hypothetical protein